MNAALMDHSMTMSIGEHRELYRSPKYDYFALDYSELLHVHAHVTYFYPWAVLALHKFIHVRIALINHEFTYYCAHCF